MINGLGTMNAEMKRLVHREPVANKMAVINSIVTPKNYFCTTQLRLKNTIQYIQDAIAIPATLMKIEVSSATEPKLFNIPRNLNCSRKTVKFAPSQQNATIKTI